MSGLKQPGQRAYEAYYSAIDGWATARHWTMVSDSERSTWAAVEKACAVPAEPEQAGKVQGGPEYDRRTLSTRKAVDSLNLERALPGERPSSHYSPMAVAFARAEGKLRVTPTGLGFIRDLSPDAVSLPEAEVAAPFGGHWHRVPPLPIDKAREHDLPDSDTTVLISPAPFDGLNSDDYRLAQLEFADGSEGHGQPYWSEPDGVEHSFEDYPYWMLPAPPTKDPTNG